MIKVFRNNLIKVIINKYITQEKSYIRISQIKCSNFLTTNEYIFILVIDHVTNEINLCFGKQILCELGVYF